MTTTTQDAAQAAAKAAAVAVTESLSKPEAAEPQDVETLTSLLVLIDRDANTKLPTNVFDFEIPYLDMIYGEDHYEVLEEDEVDVPDFNVVELYEGIRRKYRQFEGDFPELRHIFSSARQLAKELGVALPSEQEGRARALVVDHKKAARQAGRTAAKKAAKKAAR